MLHSNPNILIMSRLGIARQALRRTDTGAVFDDAERFVEVLREGVCDGGRAGKKFVGVDARLGMGGERRQKGLDTTQRA